MNACIILVGGSAARFKGEIPKQYYEYKGKRLIDYTIESFTNLLDKIIVAVREEDVEFFSKNYPKIDFVIGGVERQNSVKNSLDFLQTHFPETNFVLIADGARPFTSKKLIQSVIQELENGETAVIPAIKVYDTLKEVKDGYITKTVDRSKLWRAQTPQGFDFKTICHLHEKYKNELHTDDASFFEREGLRVKVVEGETSNVKVTTLEDLP